MKTICDISIKARKPNVATITFHKVDLEIVEVNVIGKNSSMVEKIAIKSTEQTKITDKYTIKLATPLIESETYTLHFENHAQLRNNIQGFYRGSYKDGNETK